MSKILIIDDDASLVDVLAYNLRLAGHETLTAHDGMDGLVQAQLKSPDIIILDLMLPVMDGLEVCRRLRSDPATRNAMILMLTAKDTESDELVGFSMGADDYVTKPYSVKVLLERIKVLQRQQRAARGDVEEVVTIGGITVDRHRHQVTVGGRPLSMTRSEFGLLDTLIRQPGRAFRRSELISSALGDDAIVLERTIDVHIRAVRRKLGDAAGMIETVRGVGYRFREPDSGES